MRDDHLYFTDEPLPETPEPQAQPEPWKDAAVVGKPIPRIDAYDRVSGSAVYPSDTILPDMLYGAILVCPHAHAMVKKIDTSAAEKLPGVRAIITNGAPDTDVPWYGGPGGRQLSRLFDPHCRYHGEEVAAVAAETPYQAWDAVRAISVDYEVLPFVSTEDDALKSGAPEVQAGGNRIGTPSKYDRGNVDQGFKEADVVLEHTFSTACEIHAPTEPHGCVAKWDGKQLTIWETTQGVYPVQSGVAGALRMPLSHVRVIGAYMGGGFGSKLSASKYAIMAAVLAKRTARPVKLFLPREQTFLSMGNRPPARMKLKAGVKKDGTLTALQLTTLSTGGAYAGGSGGVDYVVRELYKCPNVRTEGSDVYINAGPQRAFRAPGHPQGAWALEQMMDALAVAVQMDPVDLRLKNITMVSQTRKNMPYTTTGLADCLRDGAKAFGWSEARSAPRGTGPVRRGVGVAAGMWQGGGGNPPSTVIVKVFADGSANINMGASDIGCGTKTVMAMIVTEELGIPLDRIQIEHADTGTTQYATASGGSKTIPTESPTTRAAALDVKQQLIALAAEQLKVPPAELAWKAGEAVSLSDPTKKVALGAMSGLRRRGVIVGVGYRGPNPADKAINPFGAHFAEVAVNTLTGEVRIVRYVAAQDSGRVMNLLTYENQVIGGIAMGAGLAMMEERVLDRATTGRMLNMNWHDYKIPTALDLPADQTVVPIDLKDKDCNSTGAKGLGEPATIPAAPAIANAICHAIGVRVPDTPMNPARILALLAAAQPKPKRD
jgi:xanthine dehydrogenase YagR molybdenum-binding subunit